MSIEAIVFDLGGVLVDVDIRRAFHHWAAAAKVPIEAISSRWKRDEAYCAHERGELDDRRYFAYLRRMLGVDIGDEALLAGWNTVLGEPLADIEPLVERLAREFPLYVFSNTNPAHIAHFTPRYRKLLSYFRKIVTSCELGRRKPETEAFLALTKLVGTTPERLVFFDDLEENVQGARRAGLQAFRVAGPAEIEAISERLAQARTAGRSPRPPPGA